VRGVSFRFEGLPYGWRPSPVAWAVAAIDPAKLTGVLLSGTSMRVTMCVFWGLGTMSHLMS